MSSSALLNIYIQFTKLRWSEKDLVLSNSFPNISFTVKKTKLLVKIMGRNYLAKKNNNLI